MNEAERKQAFEKLLSRGENYVRKPGTGTSRGARRWQNSCIKWLKAHVPDSGLPTEVLLIPPPGAEARGWGLSTSGIRSVQRILKALYRCQELLPYLSEADQPRPPRPENLRRVFIVHGHDDALKVSVACLLEKLSLEPVILHEQPNRGRTIIEKFLDYSDVGFAVVLLTGDDRGGLAKQESSGYRLRARQNVILELGFFLGRLGRQHVAAVYEEGVELPSDYSGVLFIRHDQGGIWQLHLAKEIKAAGIKVDLNRL